MRTPIQLPSIRKTSRIRAAGPPPPKPKPEPPRPQSTFDLGAVNASDISALIEKLVRDQAEAMKRLGG